MTLLSAKNKEKIPSHTDQYQFVRFNDNLTDVWEKMVADSLTGTLLHTRKFIAYHGDKFDDQSLLVYDKQDGLRAIFPAACDLENNMIVASHPGITYGGLLHDGWLRGQRCLDVLSQLKEHYASAGFKELIYKAVPLIYHRSPVQDDIYALHRLGADRFRLDLSTTIDLEKRGIVSERRKRTLKKAKNLNLMVSSDFKHIDVFWQILADNLSERYSKKPVHSLQELYRLKEKFPEEIELIVALSDSQVVAGSLLFYCPTLVHAQYFASNKNGREIGALDLVVEYGIKNAGKHKKRFFDFGISTERQGNYFNDGLHTFKCEFGACGSVYEFYRLKL